MVKFVSALAIFPNTIPTPHVKSRLVFVLLNPSSEIEIGIPLIDALPL